MILPTKHLSPDRALITIGADLILLLTEPKTISRLWHELKEAKSKIITSSEFEYTEAAIITYDWFVLAIDMLYSFKAIEIEKGKIRVASHDSPNL